MREFALRVECENAAFDTGPETEVARIMADLARLMNAGHRDILDGHGVLHDSNGNRVGEWRYGETA